MPSPAAILGKLAADPSGVIRTVLALARGRWYCFAYRLRGIRVSAGRNFRVYGKLQIRGPGRIVFGNNVRLDMLVTPYTHHPDALIEIGDDSYVNGTRFGCRTHIRVGARAILAQAMIMDTNFHSIQANRHEVDAPVRSSPVILEENVWVAAQAGILPGTHIGRNSVVGFGAVCAGSYPSDVVIAGNPAQVIKPIPDAGAADGT